MMLHVQQARAILSIISCVCALRIATLLCSDDIGLIINSTVDYPQICAQQSTIADVHSDKTSILNLCQDLVARILQFDTDAFNTVFNVQSSIERLKLYVNDCDDNLLESEHPFAVVLSCHPLFLTNKAFYTLRTKLSLQYDKNLVDCSTMDFLINHVHLVIGKMPEKQHFFLNMCSWLSKPICTKKTSGYKEYFHFGYWSKKFDLPKCDIYNPLRYSLKYFESWLRKNVSNFDNDPKNIAEERWGTIISLITNKDPSQEEYLQQVLSDASLEDHNNKSWRQPLLAFIGLKNQLSASYFSFLTHVSLTELYREIKRFDDHYQIFLNFNRWSKESDLKMFFYRFLQCSWVVVPTFLDNFNAIKGTLINNRVEEKAFPVEQCRLMRNILLMVYYFKYDNVLIIKAESPIFNKLSCVNSCESNELTRTVVRAIMNELLKSVKYLYIIHDYESSVIHNGLIDLIRSLDPTIFIDHLIYLYSFAYSFYYKDIRDNELYRFDGKCCKINDVLKLPSVNSDTGKDGLVWNIEGCKTIPYKTLVLLKQKGLLDNVLANHWKEVKTIYFSDTEKINNAAPLIEYALKCGMVIDMCNMLIIENYTATIKKIFDFDYLLKKLEKKNVDIQTFLGTLLPGVTTITFDDQSKDLLSPFDRAFDYLTIFALSNNVKIEIPQYIDFNSTTATIKKIFDFDCLLKKLEKKNVDIQTFLGTLLPGVTTITFDDESKALLSSYDRALDYLTIFALNNSVKIEIPQYIDFNSTTATIKKIFDFDCLLKQLEKKNVDIQTFLSTLLPGVTTITFDDESEKKLLAFDSVLGYLTIFALNNSVKIEIPRYIIDLNNSTATIKDLFYFNYLLEELKKKNVNIQTFLSRFLSGITTITFGQQLAMYMECYHNVFSHLTTFATGKSIKIECPYNSTATIKDLFYFNYLLEELKKKNVDIQTFLSRFLSGITTITFGQQSAMYIECYHNVFSHLTKFATDKSIKIECPSNVVIELQPSKVVQLNQQGIAKPPQKGPKIQADQPSQSNNQSVEHDALSYIVEPKPQDNQKQVVLHYAGGEAGKQEAAVLKNESSIINNIGLMANPNTLNDQSVQKKVSWLINLKNYISRLFKRFIAYFK